MKAADIPDERFLSLVERFNRGQYEPAEAFPPDFWEGQPKWANVTEMAALLDAPEKVIRAKAAKLIQRGLMDGCPCGCRGDFNVPGTPVSWGRPDPIGEAIRATS